MQLGWHVECSTVGLVLACGGRARDVMTGAMMGVATMTMMAARLQVDRDREFVRLGLMMLTALAVAVEMVMRW
jgi:hypothetical protein